MKRFRDRTKRLSRQREQRVFQHVIMPVAWLFGFAGLLSLVVLWSAYLLNGTWIREVFGLFGAAACFPVLLLLTRVVRGHFSRELDEP